MVGFMNDELKKLIQEYNQVLANQSDKCEITLASKRLNALCGLKPISESIKSIWLNPLLKKADTHKFLP